MENGLKERLFEKFTEKVTEISRETNILKQIELQANKLYDSL